MPQIRFVGAPVALDGQGEHPCQLEVVSDLLIKMAATRKFGNLTFLVKIPTLLRPPPQTPQSTTFIAKVKVKASYI
jgi:hypothetical protein